MWPFDKKPNQGNSSQSLPNTLPFKSGESFFELQCKYGHTELIEGQGVVALVLDASKEFGTQVAIKIDESGAQTAIIRVASEDGGFIVPAQTPSGTGDPLKPGDVVIWVPSVYNDQVAKGLGDIRAGWVGFIRAKIAAELTYPEQRFRVICEYR